MIYCVYTDMGTFLNIGNGAGPDTVDTLERKTIMVREYTSEQDFHVDEQTLSREDWSVELAGNVEQQPNWLARVGTRFTLTPPAVSRVVTYSRQQPR